MTIDVFLVEELLEHFDEIQSMEHNTYNSHRPSRSNNADNRQMQIAATKRPPNRPLYQRQHMLPLHNNQTHNRGPINPRIDYSDESN